MLRSAAFLSWLVALTIVGVDHLLALFIMEQPKGEPNFLLGENVLPDLAKADENQNDCNFKMNDFSNFLNFFSDYSDSKV